MRKGVDIESSIPVSLFELRMLSLSKADIQRDGKAPWFILRQSDWALSGVLAEESQRMF
jgi:hypothetical protein